MDSLMEALQSGAAFRDRRKRNPRNGNFLQSLVIKHVTSVFMWLQLLDPIIWWCTDSFLNLCSILSASLSLIFMPLFGFGDTSCHLCGIGSDDLFLLSLFFLCCFIAVITAGDQSPSSPASRWPGAHYGNRTLGACLSGPDALVLHSCWLQHHSFVLSKPPKLSWSTTCRVARIAW